MAEWRKICCAVDFSEPAHLAMVEASDLAQRLGAELTLVHVFDERAPSRELLLSKFEHAVPEIERRMSEWQEEAGRIVGRPVHTIILTGSAPSEIVRFLGDGSFDLAVMATHGRSGLERLVLGSVADRVVREASCPVLVIRRPAPARATRGGAP